jgi:hypothetical protein
VHPAVTAAFFSSGSFGSDAPPRLLYGAIHVDAFRNMQKAMRGRSVTHGLDPDVFGMAPEMIALTFDARPYERQKLGALCRAPIAVRFDAGEHRRSARRPASGHLEVVQTRCSSGRCFRCAASR